MLPNMEMATANQVAEFYGVNKNNLDQLISDNKSELLEDGYTVYKGANLKTLKGDLAKLSELELYGISKFTPAIALFPKRAILRVGMLLRDSEVAKEVRTQLLNIEEHTATEVKTYEINYEQEVLGRSFKVYGNVEEPLFLASDVAEWIDHSNPTMMLKSVDEDEKRLNFVYTSTGNKDAWFLTEDGIYELLMLSRTPIAKQWKKEVELPEEGSSFVRSLQIYLVSYFET
ncbi:BRO-N domain-containing protein [Bacillus cereus]|uniref:BRO-N domain-containing protein n=1 Tax=Bacillus cereus TaxID=1396 RepID=UPI003981222B